ncbi:hypothetical protein HPB50_012556 [Hyalomma asiaticum]|uniref:Uncharacterized protein n=1 Tax=Hyalomma asiaticum TaxID=266040 RepID=A0ACB7RQN8_HYAAI|nr:hypothetical protein HPB50_012556 [Hyalomma asiaticum]
MALYVFFSQGHKVKIPEADRSPKTPLNPLNPGAPSNPTSRKKLEDIEKMLEEREEIHTAATVFFRTGLTQRLKKKFHAWASAVASYPCHHKALIAVALLLVAAGAFLFSLTLWTTIIPKHHVNYACKTPICEQALIAVAILLVAVGAFLFSLTLWTTIIPKHHVNYACKTPICEQVMKQISEYADPAVNPCDDFYSHVCGHWLRKKEGSTFMSDARKHFIARRHELLTSPFNSSEPNSHVVETAHAFYRSCLKMFNAPVVLKTALHELYTALNVSVKEWLRQTRWQKFFADSFELSLKNHFHSVFKINHYNTKNGSYYVLALGWSFYKHMRRSVPSLETNEYFRRVLEKIGDMPPPSDVVTELIQLDTTWDARAEMKGAPRSPTRVGDLSCGAFTAGVWAARFAEHGAQSDTAVVAKNFGLTCSFMEAVLQNASAQARPLYLLALLSAHILTYDFQMAVSSRAELMDDVKNFTNFGKRLQRVVDGRTWMSADDREKCAERLGGFRVTTFPDSVMSIHQLECSRFGQGDKSLSRLVLSNTFIKNFVNIYKVEMRPSCLEDQRRAMSPNTLRVIVGTNIAVDLSKRSVIVPQFLGAEPLFYVGDVDKFINIGTLTTLVASPGARLAMRRFADFPVIGVNESAQTQWSAQTLSKYENIQHCLTKGYKPHGKPLSETGFDEVLAIMDGIQVAKNTKNEFDDEDVRKDKRRRFATDALFFKRACLTLCASETADLDINEVEYNMAYAGCNYGVGRLERFHRAFGCGEKERMKHFIARRHELLTSPFNSSEPNSHVVETAHAFYRSCLKMFNAPVVLKTALHELYTALNVSVKEWLRQTRWQKFFADSFELSLKNHFHSVFKINHYSTKNGSYYVLALGWSFYKHMRRSVPSLETNEYFRRVLEKIGDTPPPSDVVTELIQLDTTWDARAEMKGAPRSPTRVGDLSCGEFTADVWAARFAEHGAQSDTAVVAKNFGLTCSFMEAVLQNASAQARPLYLLALLSAHILTYDFQMAVSSRAEEPLMDVCQQGALHLFGEMWLHALSMSLSLKRPNVQDVKNFTNFGKRLQRVVDGRTWMSADDREKCAERLGGFRVTTFPDSVMSIHQLECSRFGQGDKSLSRLVLSNTFIKNFVNIYKVEMSPSCLEDQRRAMSPNTLRVIVGTNIAVDLSKRSVIVPQFLGAEPLFYVGDVDKFINIGTLTTLVASPGARLAMRRFADFPVIGVNESAQTQWSAQTLSRYENIQHCLTKGYKPHGKPLSETGFDEVLAIMDGIEVAKNTKNEFDDEDVRKDNRRRFATDALFFKRACLTLCASETADFDINEVEYNMAYAGCNYGVGRLERFHRAFGCGEKERMWAILKCFDRYRAKDTDVI